MDEWCWNPIQIALCRGRLNHGRHFTFKSLHGEMAITLLSGGVEGGFASESCPLVAHGPWLQVYLGHKESSRILSDVDQLLAQKIPVSVHVNSVTSTTHNVGM